MGTVLTSYLQIHCAFVLSCVQSFFSAALCGHLFHVKDFSLSLLQLVVLGVHKFLLASLYPDLLIDMSSSTASIASVSTLHQFRGGRVSKLLRSAIAESFSQFTKNVLLRRSDRMYCTRRCTIYVPTVPCTVKSTIIVLSSNRSQQNS